MKERPNVCKQEEFSGLKGLSAFHQNQFSELVKNSKHPPFHFPVECNSPDYTVFLSFHKLQDFLAVSPFQKTPKDKMLNLCLSLHFDL